MQHLKSQFESQGNEKGGGGVVEISRICQFYCTSSVLPQYSFVYVKKCYFGTFFLSQIPTKLGLKCLPQIQNIF